ncbi:GNAT family N-acetyltransferase [Melissospora conviva]|uniref:GNAT family N-acetyltransferase n=1 Tax=Melissospora conviva TaxID=3388432 RepID=UPI003C1FD537
MSGEFSVVELSEDQLPAVVRLCRAALDPVRDAPEAAEIIARLRESPGRTPGLVAVVGGEVAGVALSSVGSRDRHSGHLDLLAVAPGHQRAGVGRALLAGTERLLAAAGAHEVRLAGNPPYYAWPGVDVGYTPAICLARRSGYRQDRTAWNMSVDLTDDSRVAQLRTADDEHRLAAAGITVRRAAATDRDALAAAVEAHFAGAWPVEVAHSIGRAGAGCQVALRGGQLLGFAAYGSARPSWFGPMGTFPGATGLGIGRVLLRRCLRDQYAAGVRSVQIGWVGPEPFYADAVGARIERVFFQFRKSLRP